MYVHQTDGCIESSLSHLHGRIHGSTTYAIKVKFCERIASIPLPSLFHLTDDLQNDTTQKSKALATSAETRVDKKMIGITSPRNCVSRATATSPPKANNWAMALSRPVRCIRFLPEPRLPSPSLPRCLKSFVPGLYYLYNPPFFPSSPFTSPPASSSPPPHPPSPPTQQNAPHTPPPRRRCPTPPRASTCAPPPP